jgi:hypothetical protein
LVCGPGAGESEVAATVRAAPTRTQDRERIMIV